MFDVTFCGYNSMHQTALDRLQVHGYDDYLLLLIKTEFFFEKNGVFVDMPPNTIVIWNIHSYIHYGCRKPHFNDDWIHFTQYGEDADFLQKLGLPFDQPFTVPYISTLTEYSKLIVLESSSSNPYKENVINSLMHAMLYSIANQLHAKPDIHSKNKYYHPMNELRTEILNAPYQQWYISSLADRLHISTSHFQHLYKDFFGVTCNQDIISARIKHAQFYLRTTEMSICALATFCGYDNELHFMRQFKKITGLTPSQYRTACYHREVE